MNHEWSSSLVASRDSAHRPVRPYLRRAVVGALLWGVALAGYSRPANALPPNTWVAGITSYWDSAHSTECVLYLDKQFAVHALSCNRSACWKDSTQSPAQWYWSGQALTGFFDGTQGHVFGTGTMVGNTENIVELYGNPPSAQNSIAGGGFPYVRQGSSFWDGRVEHVFWVDELFDGHLYETYHDSQWWTHQIPSCPYTGSGRGVGPSQITAYRDGSVEHVVATCQNPNNSAYELWESYYNGTWWTHSIASTATGTAPISGVFPFDSAVTSLSGAAAYGIQAILGVAQAANTLTLTVYDGANWSTSAIATPPIDQTAPVLTYTDSIGYRFFFVGSNFHIYELGGSTVDLMSVTNHASSAAGRIVSNNGSYNTVRYSDLTGFFDGQNDHIFFVNADGTVHEIYGAPSAPRSSWVEHAIGPAGIAFR